MQQDPKIIECELFELMVQASPVASMLADENGLILVVNRAAEELLDCDSTQLIQRPLADLIPCAHNYAHARLSSPTSADRNDQGQDAFKSSLILRERLPLGVDGDPVTAEVSLYSIRPRGRIFTLANIADPFYTQVGQFPDPKLDAIAEMIRGLAHECRNALQRARGCLDLLELDLVAQPQLSELAGRIRRSLEDLEHNYNEVRDFAAPIVLERQDCNVEQLLLSVYRELSSQEDSQVGQLLTNIPNDCRLNRMDPQRMAVVFRNLMVNAWQASPAGADLVARVQHVDYLRGHGRGSRYRILAVESRTRFVHACLSRSSPPSKRGMVLAWLSAGELLKPTVATLPSQPRNRMVKEPRCVSICRSRPLSSWTAPHSISRMGVSLMALTLVAERRKPSGRSNKFAVKCRAARAAPLPLATLPVSK